MTAHSNKSEKEILRSKTSGTEDGQSIHKNSASELQQHFDAHKNAEEHFQTIFNVTNDPIFIHDPSTGAIVFANEAAEKKYQHPKEQLLDMSMADLSANRPPFTQDDVQKHMEKAMSEGSQRFEWLAKAADDSMFWVEVNMTVGTLVGEKRIIVAVRDIQDRKQDEMELRLLYTTIEQSPDIILITDSDGVIQFVNPTFEKVTGYTANEAIGQKPSLVKSGMHNDEFYAELWNTILAGKIWGGRFTNKRKNGSRYTEQARISPVRDTHGKITNFVAVKRDITMEILRDEQFMQSQKMEAVGQLAGGIAHDFNNILQSILGFSEMLAADLEDGSIQYANAKEIEKSAKRASGLVNQLLAFSRAQPLLLTALDLNQAIRDCEALLDILLGEKYQVVLDPEESLCPVLADHGQTTQIIMNLAVNARDAMPNGGRLTIATDTYSFDEKDAANIPGVRQGTYACLSITDTGCGMSDATKERLFEPFFTTKDIGEGTGLGLSVVYGIVQQNNGWVNVYSEEGMGSTFKIYLPATEQSVPAVPENADTQNGHGERILLVEDEIEVSEIVMNILRSANFDPVAASNAEEALEIFTKDNAQFDILISDMMLPSMTGSELADTIRKKKQTLPVLLYSGYRDYADRWSHLEKTDYHFMTKPIKTDGLLETVRNMLNSSN